MKITFIIFPLLFLLVSCNKEYNLNSEKINFKDTIPTGNKLKHLIKRTSLKGETHVDIGILFLNQAKSGVLKELINNKKNFLDSYYLNRATLDLLIKYRPLKSKGIRLTFTELNADDYKSTLSIPNNADSILYPLVSYVKESGELEVDSHYFVFNLAKKFDINKKLSDKNFVTYRDAFKDDIYKTLSSYYSHNGRGNTQYITYTWSDIIDIIQKQNCDVNFQLAEIIAYREIEKIVDGNPLLKASKFDYQDSYLGREKQLIMLGEYRNTVKQSVVYDKYFDMGSLYP